MPAHPRLARRHHPPRGGNLIMPETEGNESEHGPYPLVELHHALVCPGWPRHNARVKQPSTNPPAGELHHVVVLPQGNVEGGARSAGSAQDRL
eukprot:scaffold32229_cov90-Isochrysis_galbana.AAC.1